MHDAPLPSDCPNCGAALAVDPHPRFCPLCGQETRLHPPSFGEFVHEFVGHYVAVEGALWRTLGALLFRPGQLTQAYLQGRRRRYVLPLRIYLSASFVFFLAVKLLGVGADTALTVEVGPRNGRTAAVQLDAGAAQELGAWMARCSPAGACGLLESRAARGMQGLTGPDGAQRISQRLSGMAPYAAFLMLPLFAALVHSAWRQRGLPYGAHFVFGLHVHAFAFLVLLLAALLPAGADDWALLLIVAHTTLAMRRVYGASWRATAWRAGAIALAYALALLVGTVGLAAVAVLMG